VPGTSTSRRPPDFRTLRVRAGGTGSRIGRGLTSRRQRWAATIASARTWDHHRLHRRLLGSSRLGPGRRELVDSLQDVREAIEREGADYPALEVELRRQIASLSSAALADRRARLTESARLSSPPHSRRDRLERSIRFQRDRLEWLSREREAVELLAEPAPGELAGLVARQASVEESLDRDLAELDALPTLPPDDPRPATPEERLEAALIDQWIDRQAAAEITAARAGDNHVIYRTLGPYPADEPENAVAWGDAARAIATYRLRHDVRDRENPLGVTEPVSGSARAERARAQNRIDTVRRRLRLEHDHVERANVRDNGIEM
jgi:hypothetical protein